MLDFTGKRVLVTGGGSGIGRAISEAFSRAGAEVLAIGLACEESLPAPIQFLTLDVTDTAAVNKLVSNLSELNVVVNAAGIIRRDDEFDLDIFTNVLDVNLVGTMRVCMAARPKLMISGGSIINIASTLSFLGVAVCPPIAQVRAASSSSLMLSRSPGPLIAFA